MGAQEAWHPGALWYVSVIATEAVLLTFLEKTGRCITDFQARKMAHAGTGLMLLQFNSELLEARTIVYVIGCGSLAVTWELLPGLRPFRFGKPRDIGMTVYSLVAMLWFWMQLPIMVLAPMFFADPAGAIFGKWLTSKKDQGVWNPVWWRAGSAMKTVGGSAAVMFFTAMTFASPATTLQRILVGFLAAMAEAIGGAYDNLLLVIVVVGSRLLLDGPGSDLFSIGGWSPTPANSVFLMPRYS